MSNSDETIHVGGGQPPPGVVPPGLRPPSGPPPSGGVSPMLIGGIVAAVLAVAVLGVVVLRGGDDGPEEPDVTAQTPELAAPTETVDPAVEPTEVADPAPTAEPAGPPTVQELAAAVVQVQLLLNGEVVCTGSGTILAPDGTILTNSHVITQDSVCPHDTIGVAITDVPELPAQLLFEADLLVNDPALDLAVIRIARSFDGSPVAANFPVVEYGDSDGLALGDELRVIGYPGIGGDTITFTEGAISGFVATPGLEERSWLKTDATISGGNSGGLAADAQGRIVGVPTIVGTGTGRITDCRVIQDTNGDGQVDQNDTCVPVGGFINGIRPFNLALPLLESALSAAPIDQGVPPGQTPVSAALQVFASDPVWTLDVVDGDATAPVDVVPAGAPVFCLTWNYEAFAVSAPFDVTWTIDGIDQPGAAASGTNQGETTGGFFACITDDSGLQAGLYEVSWSVEAQPVFTHSLLVGAGGPITITVANATETDLCVIQASPTASASFGLNRLSQVLPPGASIDIPLPVGDYDSRVIDCDGIVRFEDLEGTELSVSETLTVL